MADSRSEICLSVKNLKKYFVVDTDIFGNATKVLRAVDDISFDIQQGTTMGLVGESGCGKTTVGRSILRLHDLTEGVVTFEGIDLSKLSNHQMQKLRPQLQIIFQDPYASLNPRMPIGAIISEGVKAHKVVPKGSLKEYILRVMQDCGIAPAYYERYPHEFSGGQRQRICIARAIAMQPHFIVCDEPVSALDVSIQAQIINLLKDLQDKYDYTYLFISHDLSVVEHISDTVGVMYLGSLVEYGSKKELFRNPQHPYTKALFRAVPILDPTKKHKREIIQGELPSPVNPPKGCKFCTRCTECDHRCRVEAPPLVEFTKGHLVACHKVKRVL